MNIYLRKILKHDITHQISVTKEILNGFFGVSEEKESTKMTGKNSGYTGNVTFLLSTDPRFGGDIKQIIQNEGGMQEDDILLFIKSKNGYVLDVIGASDSRHETFITIMKEERHLIINVDAEEENPDDILNHNIFGIHIKETNDALSEEHPHICIGWSGMGDLADITTREELIARYDATWPNTNPRKKGQDIGQIWRFKNDAQIGDYVIFADNDIFHIGIITSDYYYDNTEYAERNSDYTNNRKVTWLKTALPKNMLSETFRNSLSAGMSFWTLNDYKSAVAQLLDGSYIKDELDNFENADLTFPQICVQDELSVKELGDILSDMYNSSENKTTAIHMFGIKYGEIIRNKYSANEIVRASTIPESYHAEVSKGVRIYEALINNEYGVTFAEETSNDAPITFNTGYESKFSRNRILFGAPGTGKSFTLNGDRKEILYGDRKADETKLDLSQYGEYERVTFHPDYSYANFVGTYKPVPCKDESGKDGITYEYVPGPFMRTYVKALLNSKTETPKPYLLIIEEINRANVAAVFGDVFQLLDRGEDEVSEYPIQASEDMKKYLAKKLGGEPKDYDEIRIPDNMFIWATMNSADQGVFPMDTAFKRRWDFTYLGIDDSEDGISGKTVVLGKGKQNSRIVEWNELRKAINEELLKYKVNEDKLMGPYFISKKNLPEGKIIDPEEFSRIFKNKVIMYLFDDAAKQKRTTLFEGCEEKSRNQYSKICNEFDEKGVLIFGSSISDKFTVIPEDDEQ